MNTSFLNLHAIKHINFAGPGFSGRPGSPSPSGGYPGSPAGPAGPGK